MSEVPAGWEKRTSRSTGQVYYLNQFTKQSQWDMPTSPAEPDSAPAQVNIFVMIIFDEFFLMSFFDDYF